MIERNKPIVLRPDHSTLAWIPEMTGSWAMPLCHERISSFEIAAQNKKVRITL
ncbi:MAG: hypothetical protein ACK5EU_10330 [Pseudanabaena sp.]|nr:hypothetical protein [Pseudanabaena sp. M165S2SP1A06QC]